MVFLYLKFLNKKRNFRMQTGNLDSKNKYDSNRNFKLFS